jgi:copper chaperone CopZ
LHRRDAGGAGGSVGRMTTSTTLHIDGLNCANCVAAVRAELLALPGVLDVEVDLPTGRVSVMATGPLDADSVEVAVYEAGHEVAR